nr:MAG TPA: hypothetical protein [Caudoviricetes sp.]
MLNANEIVLQNTRGRAIVGPLCEDCPRSRACTCRRPRVGACMPFIGSWPTCARRG